MKAARSLALILGMLLLILDSGTALEGAKEGLVLCVSSVIPALLPFWVLSSLLTGSLWGSYSFGLGNKQAWMSSANWLVRISGDGTKNDGSVDISKVTGNCYINVYTSSEGGSGGNLSRVWLE